MRKDIRKYDLVLQYTLRKSYLVVDSECDKHHDRVCVSRIIDQDHTSKIVFYF